MTEAKPLVLYVPGLYSSSLEPAKESSQNNGCLRERWDPPYSVVSCSLLKGNRGHRGLRLPLSWSQNDRGIYVQDKDDMEAADCLHNMQNELLKFLTTLHENDLIEFHKIVWDWRRSFEEAEAAVAQHIESAINGENRKAILLTHSTGAMLSWPTISRHPEWFAAWVNAAGCLMEGNNLFHKEFAHGWSESFIRLITKEDFFSFPGLYSYFPLPGEICGGHGETNYAAEDGSHYSQSELEKNGFRVHDIAIWEEFKLGIFSWKKDVTELEREHLKHCLATAKRYRESLLKKGQKLPRSQLSGQGSQCL